MDTLELHRGPPASVTYWAISVLSSRTMWLNSAAFLVALLSATDVLTIIPAKHLPLVTALVAGLNLYLRTMTVRPVAFIAAGATLPITVSRLVTPPSTGSAP